MISNRLGLMILIVLALVSSILPIPSWVIWGWPDWVLLVLIEWTIALPTTSMNCSTAWVTGLTVDLLHNTMLGEHACAYTMIIYVVSRFAPQLYMYSLLQQGLSIACFMFFYQCILYCLQGFINTAPNTYLYWLPIITSTLVWPWLANILQQYRRWLQITY